MEKNGAKKEQQSSIGRIEFTPGAGELEELAFAREDDESDLGIAKDREIMSLLHKPTAALRECHLARGRILDPLDLDLPTNHNDSPRFSFRIMDDD